MPGSERRTESERLRRKIELVLPALSASGRRLLSDPRIAALYPEYLFASHCIVRGSVPLMEAALERSNAMLKTDPVAAGLALYLKRHIPEEIDHDAWLLDDLETLGVDRSAVLARLPPATVAGFVGAQYYWIFHYHPVALLGYIAVLEGYPPLRADVERLMETTGYGEDSFRTLLHHADLDPGHGGELWRTLDELRLSSEQATAVGVSAMSSVLTMGRIIDDIVEQPPA